jgi:hypothetical protein
MRRLGLAASLIVLAAVAPPAWSDCPTTTYVVYPVPFVTYGSVHDTTFIYPPNGTGHGRYNVGAGQIGAESHGSAAIYTDHEDDFTLIGIPAGTPFTFTARARFTGRAVSSGAPGDGDGAIITGRLRDAFGNEAATGTSVGETNEHFVDDTVALTVSGVAGTPFRLRFTAETYAIRAEATLQGELSFAGLPAGASLTSCRGYNSAAPVPVRTTTWGAIKTLYR